MVTDESNGARPPYAESVEFWVSVRGESVFATKCSASGKTWCWKPRSFRRRGDCQPKRRPSSRISSSARLSLCWRANPMLKEPNWLDDYKQRLALMTDSELDEEREHFADPNSELPGSPRSHAERRKLPSSGKSCFARLTAGCSPPRMLTDGNRRLFFAAFSELRSSSGAVAAP